MTKDVNLRGGLALNHFDFCLPRYVVASKMFSVTREQNVKLYAMLKQVIREYFETSVAKQKIILKNVTENFFASCIWLLSILCERANEMASKGGGWHFPFESFLLFIFHFHPHTHWVWIWLNEHFKLFIRRLGWRPVFVVLVQSYDW